MIHYFSNTCLHDLSRKSRDESPIDADLSAFYDESISKIRFSWKPNGSNHISIRVLISTKFATKF